MPRNTFTSDAMITLANVYPDRADKLTHNLRLHPLLALEALVDMAARLPADADLQTLLELLRVRFLHGRDRAGLPFAPGPVPGTRLPRSRGAGGVQVHRGHSAGLGRGPVEAARSDSDVVTGAEWNLKETQTVQVRSSAYPTQRLCAANATESV